METPAALGEGDAPRTEVEGQRLEAREYYVPAGHARLFVREIGQGQPVVVLHGGPGFDHTYLLPELDRLAGSARLIYYDQRGRGRSTAGADPETVGLASEMADIEMLRQHLQLDSVALLGHSWGGLLAVEYATRFPRHVSHLILMNSAPGSYRDWVVFEEELLASRAPGEAERMEALGSSTAYEEGDADTRAEYYRLHFRPGFAHPDQLELLVARLRAAFEGKSRADLLMARQVSARLFDETVESSQYDLLPRLTELRIPTLVIHGDHDFIPVRCVAGIAETIPDARLLVLENCGHFAAMEALEAVHTEISAFLEGANQC